MECYTLLPAIPRTIRTITLVLLASLLVLAPAVSSDAAVPCDTTGSAMPGLVVNGANGAAKAVTDKANVSESWQSQALAQIAEMEYHVKPTDQGLSASNRQQGLKTYFTQNGIRVVEHQALDSMELLSLKYLGLTRDTDSRNIQAAKPGELKYDKERVELAQGKGVVEWYENSPKGVEHGFVINEKPAGEGVLSLQLHVGSAAAKQYGNAVQFVTPTGQTLNYGHLWVKDAEQKEIPAHLGVTSENTLAIRIDDTQAFYPLVVDPLIFVNMLEVNQASAQFGASVASAGDVNGDGYDDVIVGADHYDNGQNDEGAAFVYYGSATGLNTTYDLMLEVNRPSSFFGSSVASAGDVNGDGYADVIVGAPSYSLVRGNRIGAAFMYYGSPLGLNATYDVMLAGNQADSRFGDSVASAGDVNGDGYDDVIVGAFSYDNGQANVGAAFVYYGSVAGLSTTYDVMLESNQASPIWGFGSSVASAGDVNGDGYDDVIVGAPDNNNGFVYYGSIAGLSTTYDVMLASSLGGHFGWSVATAGDVNGDGYDDVIVGAPDNNNGFVYYGSVAGLSTTYDVMLVSNQGGDFGWSVASAGDVNGDGYADVIVGAWSYTDGEVNEGAVFVYLGSATGMSTTYDVMWESNRAFSNFGFSVASAGDVNGDGHVDVIVGAESYDNGQTNEGAAFLYQGVAFTPDKIGVYRPSDHRFYLDANGNYVWDADADLIAKFGVPGDIPIRGDWNGDGVDEIGVWRPDTHRFILDTNGNYILERGIDIIANFGAIGDLPVVGDWDGDGVDEIGTYRPSTSQFYLDMNGNNRFDGTEIDLVVTYGEADDIPIVGDWNGDGIDEIGVRRPSSRRFILDVNRNYTLEGDLDINASFGAVDDLPVAGDWNGDGIDEIGVWRPSKQRFFLDTNGNYSLDAGIDLAVTFGIDADLPVTGKW